MEMEMVMVMVMVVWCSSCIYFLDNGNAEWPVVSTVIAILSRLSPKLTVLSDCRLSIPNTGNVMVMVMAMVMVMMMFAVTLVCSAYTLSLVHMM